MANYQELLSRAVNALPDNSGASRREIYEKARKALVTQLRAISPPLPAREITRHRLELEDCIRQVEYDATETLLGSLKDLDEDAIAQEASDQEASAQQAEIAQEGEPAPDLDDKKNPVADLEPAADLEPNTDLEPDQPSGIDAIIAQAEKVRNEAAPAPNSPASQDAPASDDDDMEARPATVTKTKEAEPNKDASAGALEHQLESSMVSGPQSSSPQSSSSKDFDDHEEEEPFAPAHQTGAVSATTTTNEAMSRVREVELDAVRDNDSFTRQEHTQEHTKEPVLEQPGLPDDGLAQSAQSNQGQNNQGQNDHSKNNGQEDVAQKAVDRAIEVLDREARGEHVPIEEIGLNDAGNGDAETPADLDEAALGAENDEERSGNALTIFLLLAVVLLASVGGGGYWAWRAGYIDLDALFATSAPAIATDTAANTASKPDPQGKLLEGGAQGPGNTATDNNIANPSEKLVSSNITKGQDQLPSAQDQLPPTNDMAANSATPAPEMTTPETPAPEAATPLTTPDGVRKIAETPGPNTATDTNKSEDRLTTSPIASEPTLATDSAKTNDTVATGTQSLLLEASADGTTGAVPFSGTVKWSRGLDELGQPTLIGTANIPARNLGVKVLIRRNADPTLPASHLMEIDFTVTPTFVGGAVAGLPGILLKNEELVQGKALIGASARVVGNSFLFALSAAAQDVRTNINLLKTQKWMDLAIIYATGRRAIITLEKDAAAQKMFDEVLATWQSEAEAAAGKPTTPGNSN